MLRFDRDARVRRRVDRKSSARRRRQIDLRGFLTNCGFEELEARQLLATTIHVTQTADANALNPATSPSTTAAANGPVSLRSAIDFVDNQTAAQLVANGPYTIVFDLNGTFTNTLAFNGNQDNTGGALSIFNPNGSLDLTIQGNGAANTIIDGNNIDSVFLISPSGLAGGATFTNVTFDGVTIQHGLSQEDNGGGINYQATTSSADPGPATGSGSVIVQNSVITSNHAATIAAGFGGNGGGVFVGTNALQPSPVSLIVSNSTISNNTADRGGGGIDAVNAGVFLDEVTVSGNHAKLFDTTGLGGGGIGLVGGTKLSMRANNTTIAGNDTVGSGGGVNVSGAAASMISLNNVTIADNRANTSNGAGQGGGINVSAGTVQLKNTIVARNFVGSAGSTADDVKGALDPTSSFNLFGTGGSGGLAAANGNQINVANPGLGTLSNNGGSTLTIPLLAGSPAIDAGQNFVEFSLFDQRNSASFPRLADGPDADLIQTTDIGAFEADPSIAVIPNQTVVHDHSGSVNFNIGDTVFLAPNPTITSVTATSDNQTIQPDAGLVLSGSGQTRTLSYTPAASQFGTLHVTVTVTASNGQSMSTTFTLDVTDQAPTVSNFSKAGQVGTDVMFTAADFTSHFADADAGDTLQSVRIDTLPPAAAGTLKLGISNVSAGQVIPVGQLGNLVFTPLQGGSPTFTWTASDGLRFAVVDATVTLNITDQANLAVTKTGPANVVAGTNITYTVTVTNNGPGTAASVELDDTLPAGTTFVSQTQGGAGPQFTLSHNGNAISDTIASLPSGQSQTFTFVAAVGANVANNASLSNTASASSTTPDPDSQNNSATATTTVLAQADLVVTKTGPANVVAGAKITYSVTLTNNGPSDAQSVTLADSLPTGTTFDSQAQNTGPSFTLSHNGNAISDTIATLPAGASATFTIVALVAANVASNSNLSNTATGSSSTTDTSPQNNSATATTTVLAQADIAVTKTGPANIVAGTKITYSVSITNNGPSDAQSVTLADTLPAGTTFDSQTQNNGPVFTLSNVGNAISDTIATLAAGASATFSIVAVVGPGVANNSTLSNTATGSSSTTDTSPQNNSATAITTVLAQADLAMTKTGPATVGAGTKITYSVTLTNNGPSDAQGVTLADTLPAGTTFDSQAQNTGPVFTLSHNGNAISDTISTLPAGASATFTFVALVAANVANNATLSNTATCSSSTTDTSPQNNSATAITTVLAQADLAVTKTGPATVIAGTKITYSITITNNGPSDAQSVTLADTLPASITFDSQVQNTGPAFTLSHNGNAISDTITTLPAGASATFTIVALVAANVANNSALSNTATGTASTTDPSPQNNNSTATTTVLTRADLAITKTGPATVIAGTKITYSVTLTNNGPSDAQSVTVADTLPAGTTFDSQTQNSGPAFTLSNSGNAISDTIATLLAGASATFTYVALVLPSVPNNSTLSNTATGTTSTTDTNSENDSATATTTVLTRADLAITKTAPATVIAGTKITYSITLTNNGPSDAQAVAIADTLPGGTTFDSQTQNTGPAFTLSHNGNAISDTIATLPAGATATFTFVALVAANVPNNATLSNTATASTATTDPSPQNNSSTATTTVLSQADLAVTKTAPATAIAGTVITYSVTIRNNGPSDAQSVSLFDAVPPGATFLSQSQTSGPAFALSNNGNFVNDTIATLAAGTSASFSFVVQVNPSTAEGTSLANTATGSSATTDLIPSNNSATATATILTRADVAVTKTGPATIIAGTRITYTLQVTNNGPSDAKAVALADLLPAGTTIVSQSQQTGPDFVRLNNGNAISDTVSTLAAGVSATFTVIVQTSPSLANGSTLSNTANVSSITTDLVPANNSSTATTTVITQADLAVTKTGPAQAVAGTRVTYTVTLTNNGPSDTRSVALADMLPAGTTFVSQTQTSGPAFSLSNTGNAVSDIIAIFPAGSAATFAIIAIVSPSVANSAILSNTATATTATTDPNPQNNSATATTTVTTQADLAVTKTGPGAVTAGTDITYSLSVTNRGPSDAQMVGLSDTLPAGSSFVSQTQNTGPAFVLSNTGNAISDTIATLPAGASATFTIVAHVASSVQNRSALSNTAIVKSATNDPTPSNNSASTTANVQTSADLSVTKTGPPTAVLGTRVTYSITVANNGPSDAQGVTLTDKLLPNFGGFISQTQNSGPLFNLTRNGAFTTESIATLPAGASATFTLILLLDPSGPTDQVLKNTASVGSITADPNSGNNSASVSTTPERRVDLEVMKSGPVAVIAGNMITYTLVLTNHGPSSAMNVSLVDAVPLGSSFVSQTQLAGSPLNLFHVGPLISDTTDDLGLNASATIRVVALVNPSIANGTKLSNTAITTSTGLETAPGNNSATATTTVFTAADLAVTKTAPQSAVAGTRITYTLTLTNNGPSDSQSVVLADTLPAGTTFVSQSQISGPAFTLGHNGNAVNDTIATFAVGATARFAVVALVNSGVADGSTIRNTVNASAATPDDPTTNNVATASTTVSTRSDVAVTLNGPTLASTGSLLTYTMSVANQGPSDARNVMLTDSLPSGVTFVSQMQTSGPAFSLGQTGGTTNGIIAILRAGEMATFSIVGMVNRNLLNGSSLRDIVSVSSAPFDPVPTNNAASVTTRVTSVPFGMSSQSQSATFALALDAVTKEQGAASSLLPTDPTIVADVAKSLLKKKP